MGKIMFSPPEGVEYVQMYDVRRDEMVMVPKDLADEFEALKTAFMGAEPNTEERAHFYEAAMAAADVMMARAVRPFDTPPEPEVAPVSELAVESLEDHDRRHAEARERGPADT